METTKSGRVVRSMNDMLKTEMIEYGEEEEEEEEEDDDEDDDDDDNFGESRRKKKVPKKRGSGSGGGSVQVQPCYCQVEGCTFDMTNCKTYHRRHKVCEVHFKAPVVITGGCQQRFCQQCSRFHDILEFDDAKRSCRRRLAGHNERRRKISYETYGEGS